MTTPYKFMGATAKSASLTGGNSGSAATLTVDLVEDPKAGDAFVGTPPWHPATFECGELRFRGLVQHHSRRVDDGSAPAYRVVLVEPREILEGVSVVVSDVFDRVDVPNLLNVYGYWEDRFGFGGALVDEMGMLWDGRWPDLGLVPGGGLVPEDAETADPVGLRPGLEILANGASPYSGGIRFRGKPYKLDLSGLPKAPEPFRVGGGPVLTLAQVVADLCDAAGHDFRVELGDDDVLRFQSFDRNRPQAPGTVAVWAASLPERPKALSTGVEMVSEAANAVIWGGRVQNLNQVFAGDSDAIWPFWGYNADGTVVWGEGYPERENHRFVVPCDAVADVVGAPTYACSMMELRASVDMDSWAAYLVRREPEKAAAIDLASVIDAKSDLSDLFGELMLQRDLLADDRKTAVAFGAMNENEFWSERVQRLYDFVQALAREYMGRKFLVRLPFPIYEKVVPGRFDRVATHELCEGGYLPEQGVPLGLPYEEVDAFLTDDGLFGCFVSMPYQDRMDWSPEASGVSVIAANGTVYVKAKAEKIVTVPGKSLPYVVVELEEEIYATPTDPLGGVKDVAELLGLPVEQIRRAAGLRTGSFPVRMSAPCYRPQAAAVPTLSNRERYTHERWRSGDGTQGRVETIVDDDLTPWTCGDVSSMIAAGEAVVKGMTTRRLEVETASVTLVGAPVKSLGETLAEGGPGLTGIQISFGQGGIETSYEMRTYTPVNGSFGRQYAERLKKMGSNLRLFRRNARNAFKKSREVETTRTRARAGLMLNTSRAVAQRSPHECLAGMMLRDGAEGEYRTAVATLSPAELMANMRADSPDFVDMAGMGMEGLLRPFSTNFDQEEQEGVEGEDVPRRTALPHFEKPHESIDAVTRILPTTKDLNPFEDCDVDLLVTGDEYAGNLHRKKAGENPVDYGKARALGLRGPLVVEGFGLELTGKPFPNAGDETLPVQDWSDEFLEDHRRHPERWKAGIFGNLMWCEWTGTWLAAGTILEGRTETPIAKNQVGTVKVRLTEDGELSDETLEARNGMSGTIPTGSTVYLGYNAVLGRWTVIGADCPV